MTPQPSPPGIWKIITASSVGTLIEWYDFYIFGSLAPILAVQFFPGSNPTAALLSTLATFAAGFVVRPFGALVFGRLGDIVGRKYTFLLTLVIMGGSTFAIGLVPGYAQIGFLAPLLVLILRLLQGLALGGEYGGAATYVAEHAPPGRRGFYTSWIQTTATLGLLLSLGIILITRHSLHEDPGQSIERFNRWGWRIPFWFSVFLVSLSLYIRLRMKESPLFSEIKSAGKTSSNPLKESFTHKVNLKMVLLALFGAVMGQGVVWYTGQFYAQSFIENVARVDFEQSRTILIWSIVLATPFFVIFGNWSDRIGRKWIMMAGMMLAIISYRPIYQKILSVTDISSKTEMKEQEKVKRKIQPAKTENYSLVSIQTQRFYTDGTISNEIRTDTLFKGGNRTGQSKAGMSQLLPPAQYAFLVILVFFQILYVTMVYGPIAAFLVELFPTRIRYTSMSLPYHVGNGIFGGMTPFIATLLTTIYTGDKLVGLWYPIAVAFVCLVIGTLYISNKIDPNVND